MRKRASFVVLCWLCAGWVSIALAVTSAPPRLTGSTTLSIAGFPLPCTIVDEIRLETPCERTVFAWDIELGINLRCTFDSMAVILNTMFGIPGVEHVVAGFDGTWGGFTVRSEMNFAVPYESVVDVNNLPNVVVVPPGEFLFAQARVEGSGTFSGVNLRWITVFQDLNFPNPAADYNPPGAPDFYRAADQSFALGSIITLTSDIGMGMRLTAQMCLGAEPGSFSVKKHSTFGRANPDAMHLTVSLTNIAFPCPWCVGPFSNLRGGITARILPRDDPFISFTGSVSLTLFEDITIGTSFTIGILTGLTWGGFSVNIPSEFGTLNILLDATGGFRAASLNLRYAHQFNFGWTSGSCSATLTATADRGVTGVSFSLALTQGLLMSSYGLSFSLVTPPGVGLAFSALNVRFTLNLSPVQVGFALVFGRGGLAQFGVTVGYVF